MKLKDRSEELQVVESPLYRELERERDEKNRVIKKIKKEVGQYKKLFSLLSDEFHREKPSIKTKSYVLPKKETRINESAVLLLSDMHSDIPVKSERVQGYEDYNWNACCHRAQRLVDTTISHLCENMTSYNFPELWVMVMGDNTSGEIHDLKRHSEWQNSFKSSMYTGALIASMLEDFARYFPVVKVVCVSGNHPRRSTRVDWKAPLENFDYLTMMYAKSKLQGYVKEGRMEFVIPDAWSVCVDIRGYNFLISHGHQSRQNSLGLPYYGLERKSRRMISLGAKKGITYNYFVQGHQHTQASIEHPTGELIMNGAFLATDEYVFEEKSGVNEPSQLLFGVHDDYGASWRMPINLRVKNWEKKEKERPSRYNIEI